MKRHAVQMSIFCLAAMTLISDGRPDAKTQKYDRQLRLWAHSGQSALERSRILVISASSTSCQALKNLVLPGLGHFTLLDGGRVSARDAGNFFIRQEKEGLSKAEEASFLLRELNESVSSKAEVSSLHEKISGPTDWWESFDLVLAVGLTADDELILSDLTWRLGVNTMFVQVSGFVASLRLQVREHTVSDTHADPIPDLRLSSPFPELLEHADKYELETMSSFDKGHVPYPIILLKEVQSWRSTHNGALPTNSQEIKEFKARLKKKIVTGEEENYIEAVSQTHQAYKNPCVPVSLETVLKDRSCLDVNKESSPFWIIASAMKEYLGSCSPRLPPVNGAIPDMKSSTSEFIELQSIYKSRANKDLASLREHVEAIKTRLDSEVIVSDEDMESFIKNVESVQVQRGRSLRMERITDVQTGVMCDLINELDMMTGERSKDPTPMSYYLAIQAAAAVAKAEIHTEAEEDSLQIEMERYIKEWTAIPDITDLDQAIDEIKKTWGVELPTVAALMGGIISQEAIKLLTSQYVPVNNICVWDGIKCRIGVFSL